MKDEQLVSLAFEVMSKAIVFNRDKSKDEGFYPCVGVAILMKDDSIITGFNIESYGHKGYHAEEVAVIAALRLGYKKGDFVAIAIVYNFAGVYPACLSCRQVLSDFGNLDMKVISFSTVDVSGKAFTLRDLCPMPYPDYSIRKDDRKNMI